MPKQDEIFLVGKVVGVHGIRGHLKVRPLTEDSDSLLSASRVWLETDGVSGEYQPLSVKFHKGSWLVQLAGVDDRTQAESLRGSMVSMLLPELPELETDEHYWHQLEGAEIVDEQLGSIGRLKRLLATPAHDIYEVHGPFGEVMIPVVDEMIKEVDAVSRTIRVDLPDGLINLTDED